MPYTSWALASRQGHSDGASECSHAAHVARRAGNVRETRSMVTLHLLLTASAPDISNWASGLVEAAGRAVRSELRLRISAVALQRTLHEDPLHVTDLLLF